MLAETSKYIPGTGNKYSVTDDGRIYSHSRVDTIGRLRKGRWIKTHINANGYHCIANPIDGETKVHRIVAKSFLGEPSSGLQVNHKNGVKTDNRAENLEWCTPSRNTQHAYDGGLIPKNHLKEVFWCSGCGRAIKTKGGLATHEKACQYI